MERSDPRPLEDKDAALSPTDPIIDNILESNRNLETEVADAPIVPEFTPIMQTESLSIQGLRRLITDRRLGRLSLKQAQLTHQQSSRRTVAKNALRLPFESGDKGAVVQMLSSNTERRHANKTYKRLGKTLERGIAMQMLAQSIGFDGISINSEGYKKALDVTNLTGKEKRGSMRGARAYKRTSKRMFRTRSSLQDEAAGLDPDGIVIADKLSKIADKAVRIHGRISTD